MVEEGCEIISQYGGIALEGNYEFSEIFREVDLGKTRLATFKCVENKTNSIVIHLRLNNRLVQASHALNWLDPSKVITAAQTLAPGLPIEMVSDFDFTATNQQALEHLQRLRKAVRDGPNPGSILLPISISNRYLDEWKRALNFANVRLVHADEKVIQLGTGGLTEQFLGDFEYLQRASTLFFWGSTFHTWHGS